MDIGVAGIGLVPLIIGAVALLKQSGLEARWAGLVAFIAGIATVEIGAAAHVITAAGATAMDPFTAGVVGAAVGLAAAGLYSTVRAATATS